MRNLTQETNIIKSMLAWAGFFVLGGAVIIIIAVEYWIISEYIGPMFWIMQGLWAIGVGIVISTIAALTRSGQDAQNVSTKVDPNILQKQ